jgi:hypothetical protein
VLVHCPHRSQLKHSSKTQSLGYFKRTTNWYTILPLPIDPIRPFCPWLRRLVAGLSLRRLEFDPRSVYVRFVVDVAALLQVPSSRSNSVFFCQYNPTDAPNTFVYYRRCTNSTTDSVLKSQQKKGRNASTRRHETIWNGRTTFKEILYAVVLLNLTIHSHFG